MDDSRRFRLEDEGESDGRSHWKAVSAGVADHPEKVPGTRRRRSKKAEVVPGYWVFEVVATALERHIILSLLTEVFSTETPGFKSQNDTIERWLRCVAPSISPTAIWLFDRGFDGRYILNVLCDMKQICGAEDVRVQTLRAISRLVRLASMALAWFCLLLLQAPVTAANILARAKTVGREPLLLVYRIAMGLRLTR